MLILSRRTDESIVISKKGAPASENVTVTLLSIKGKQVRIGIFAPDDVAVHREEIYNRIQQGQAEDKSKAAVVLD